MKLSVLIPAYNESLSLPSTVKAIYDRLAAEQIPHEILVVNDNSTDTTGHVLEQIACDIPTLRWVTHQGPHGYGHAVQYGLEKFTGDCVAIMMADLSDSPADLVKFYRKMTEGNYDCVFGSRFIKGGKVTDYPFPKLVLNRLANFIVRVAANIKYNDCTCSFKLYRKQTVEGLKPFLAPHFNFTLELPLKAIIRGYSYVILPNSWQNRKYGVSKFKIKELGSRYFFILLYCLIEKYFSKGDFRKNQPGNAAS